MDGPPSTTTPTPPLAPPNDDAVSISTNCKDMHRSDSKTGLVWRSGAFAGQFGDNFIQLARSVYIENDNRAKIKAEINRLTNSTISEVKSYKAY